MGLVTLSEEIYNGKLQFLFSNTTSELNEHLSRTSMLRTSSFLIYRDVEMLF